MIKIAKTAGRVIASVAGTAVNFYGEFLKANGEASIKVGAGVTWFGDIISKLGAGTTTNSKSSGEKIVVPSNCRTLANYILGRWAVGIEMGISGETVNWAKVDFRNGAVEGAKVDLQHCVDFLESIPSNTRIADLILPGGIHFDQVEKAIRKSAKKVVKKPAKKATKKTTKKVIKKPANKAVRMPAKKSNKTSAKKAAK